jgi:hypothetical protein
MPVSGASCCAPPARLFRAGTMSGLEEALVDLMAAAGGDSRLVRVRDCIWVRTVPVSGAQEDPASCGHAIFALPVAG